MASDSQMSEGLELHTLTDGDALHDEDWVTPSDSRSQDSIAPLKKQALVLCLLLAGQALALHAYYSSANLAGESVQLQQLLSNSSNYRVALLVAGLAVGHKASSPPGPGRFTWPQLVNMSADLVQQRVVEYNQQKYGFEFDTFLHSNSDWLWHDMVAAYNPHMYEWGSDLGCPPTQDPYLCSMWRAHRMLRRVEQRENFRYRWVIAFRPDILFLNNYDLGALNPDLLYVAHWCQSQALIEAAKATIAAAGTSKPYSKWQIPIEDSCAQLDVPHEWEGGVGGVAGFPDFIFTGTSATIETMVGHRPSYPTTNSGGSHNVFRNVACFHGFCNGLIGRYGYHEIDFSLSRYLMEEDMAGCTDHNATQINDTLSRQPSEYSRCGASKSFCTCNQKLQWLAQSWLPSYPLPRHFPIQDPLYPNSGWPQMPWICTKNANEIRSIADCDT